MFSVDKQAAEIYLGKRPPDPVALAAGIASVIIVGALAISMPAIARAAAQGDMGASEVKPFEYIEARLLKYGEEKDPNKLPDRVVPPLPTQPEEVLALDRNETKPEPEKKEEKKETQRDAVTDDKLREVFERAQAFAEVRDDFIPEGHPDGVPDGDVTDPALASVGATYGRRVVRAIDVRYPTLIDESSLRKLKAKVHLRFDIDMRLVGYEFKQKSGNKLFDDAIAVRLDQIKTEETKLPSPPEAIAPNVFGGGIVITFHGKDGEYQ